MLIWRNMKTVQTPGLPVIIIGNLIDILLLRTVRVHALSFSDCFNRVLYGITTNLPDRWLLRLSLLVIPAVKSHKR